jgi:2-polyprenyl-3-methyl-5-hydroxy-6-metoxy-1,4-benzoquinol methylase
MIEHGPVGPIHHTALTPRTPLTPQRFRSSLPNSEVHPAVQSYRRDIAPFARPFAERATAALLSRLPCSPVEPTAQTTQTILDHGSGTGQIGRMIHHHRPDLKVHSVDPSEGLLSDAPPVDTTETHWAAKQNGTAQDLCSESMEFAGIVSGLVFSFVPDPAADLAHLLQCSQKGAPLAVVVLGGPKDVVPFTRYWEALVDTCQSADVWSPDRYPHLKYETPNSLAKAATAAGWRNVETSPVKAVRRISALHAWGWLNRALPIGIGHGYDTPDPAHVHSARALFMSRWHDETQWRSAGWLLTAHK